MTDFTPLTAADLDAIEHEHSSTLRGGLGPVCGECEELVPCRTLRLVAMARRVEELERVLAYDEIHEAFVRSRTPTTEATHAATD